MSNYPDLPGVQIYEVRLDAPPIVGVGTSTAAFVGKAPKPTADAPGTFTQHVGVPYLITSADQFVAEYFGLPADPTKPYTNRSTPLSHAVLGFFANGGTACYVLNATSAGDVPTPAELKTAIGLLEPIRDIEILAAPGSNDPVVMTALRDQAESLADRFAILDPADTTPAPQALVAPLASEYAAIYYPKVKVSKVLSTDPDAGEFVTPVGHIAGVYARVDASRGVHKAPANEAIRNVLGVDQLLTDSQQNVMNPKGINVLRVFSGNVVIWGARTVSTDVTWRYINVRRLVTYIEGSLHDGLRWAVFEPNNLTLRKQISRSVTDFLTEVWRDGALFGAVAAQAFYVRFPDSYNTDADRAEGKLTMEIGLRVTYPAEFIKIRIGLLMQDASTA